MNLIFAEIACAFALGIALAGPLAPVRAYLPAAVILGAALLPFLAGRKIFRLLLAAQMILLGMTAVQTAAQRPAQAVEKWAPLECAGLEGIVADLPGVALRGKSQRVRWVLQAERLLRLRGPCPDKGTPPQPAKIFERLEARTVAGKVQVFIVNPKHLWR